MKQSNFGKRIIENFEKSSKITNNILSNWAERIVIKTSLSKEKHGASIINMVVDATGQIRYIYG